jgi:hypothetical protein
MALTNVTRARVIMDLIKDGDVTNETPYDDGTVDLLDGYTSLKYAQAFWDSYYTPEDPENPIESPTNAQLAAFMVQQLRKYFRAVLRSVRASAAATAAREAELDIVDTEVDSELGN